MSDDKHWHELGFGVEPHNPFEKVSFEVEFLTVDPAVLGILTGGVMGTPPPEPTFAIEVYADIPWRWRQWQWWLQHTPWRRPKRKWYTLIPHARLTNPTDD